PCCRCGTSACLNCETVLDSRKCVLQWKRTSGHVNVAAGLNEGQYRGVRIAMNRSQPNLPPHTSKRMHPAQKKAGAGSGIGAACTALSLTIGERRITSFERGVT